MWIIALKFTYLYINKTYTRSLMNNPRVHSCVTLLGASLSIPGSPPYVPPNWKHTQRPCISLPGLLKYHRLGGLNNRHLFLTVLQAGRPRSGCQQGLVQVRIRSWLADGCLLAVSSHGRERKRKQALGSLLISPSWGLHTASRPRLNIITPQRPHPPILAHGRVELQHEFGAGTQTFSP